MRDSNATFSFWKSEQKKWTDRVELTKKTSHCKSRASSSKTPTKKCKNMKFPRKLVSHTPDGRVLFNCFSVPDAQLHWPQSLRCSQEQWFRLMGTSCLYFGTEVDRIFRGCQLHLLIRPNGIGNLIAILEWVQIVAWLELHFSSIQKLINWYFVLSVWHLLVTLSKCCLYFSDLSHEVPLSKVAVQLFMEQCLKLTSWALIEGYSNVKKCTNEGRALMQLDFQIYLVEISKVCLL